MSGIDPHLSQYQKWFGTCSGTLGFKRNYLSYKSHLQSMVGSFDHVFPHVLHNHLTLLQYNNKARSPISTLVSSGECEILGACGYSYVKTIFWQIWELNFFFFSIKFEGYVQMFHLAWPMAGPRNDSQRLKTVAGGGETVTAMIMIDEGGCAMSSPSSNT